MIFKPLIIPIFIPNMGCPHRCIFCNQAVITSAKKSFLTVSKVKNRINSFLEYSSENRHPVQVSFYGGNFLGLSKHNICYFLDIVNPFIMNGSVENIRFSTRPDTINAENLSVIEPYLIKTVELGVQSMNNSVLELSKRGHTSKDTVYAVSLLKNAGYEVGIQMMLGLPGDSDKTVMQTASSIAEVSPNFVRIYPTLIMKDSLLSDMYHKGYYNPLKLSVAVDLTKKIFLFFRRKKIPVIRMGLQASKELDREDAIIAGPYHPSFGHMVYSSIFLDAIRDVVSKVSYNIKDIIIEVHPENISRVQGLRFNNIKSIKAEFTLKSILINQCNEIGRKYLKICGQLVKVY